MSNWSDVIGGADLKPGIRVSLTYDRFNFANQAISLDNGYLIAPPGIYFSGDFSFTAWLKIRSLRNQMNIIDFGVGAGKSNVLIKTDGNAFCVNIYFYNSPSWSMDFFFDSNITLNKWYHIALVCKSMTNKIIQYPSFGNCSFFLDSFKIGFGQFYSPFGEKRNSNFIGRSNWEYDNLTGSYANVVYDEFKIYQGAMTDDEVQKDFSNFFLVLT